MRGELPTPNHEATSCLRLEPQILFGCVLVRDCLPWMVEKSRAPHKAEARGRAIRLSIVFVFDGVVVVGMESGEP